MVRRRWQCAFELLPAIDLRGGRVVRLGRATSRGRRRSRDDPVAVARGVREAGARWLHVVDLDGARTGSPVHGEVIARRSSQPWATGCAVEVAGGLRTAEAVAAALDAARRGRRRDRRPPRPGVRRSAGRSPRAGAHRGRASTSATGSPSAKAGATAPPACVPIERDPRTLAAAGVATFEVTAIERDGLLGGPDLALYERLVALGRGRDHRVRRRRVRRRLLAVRAIGCAGAIVGRALYDGSRLVRL